MLVLTVMLGVMAVTALDASVPLTEQHVRALRRSECPINLDVLLPARNFVWPKTYFSAAATSQQQ